MRYAFSITVLLCVGALLYSCAQHNAEIQDEIRFRITPGSETADPAQPLSALIEDCRIVPLETTADNLISYIYKIESFGDKLFILDKKAQSKILVFDLNGRYLYAIGTQGKAQNEYITLGGFTIDPAHQQLLILDDVSQKVNFYDLDGTFRKSIPLDFIARDIAALGNGKLAFTGGGQDRLRLHITDTVCKIETSAIPSNGKNWVMLLNAFAREGDSLIYRNYLNDTLYTITPEGEIVSSRFVDFGSEALTWAKFQQYDSYQQENIEEQLSKYDANLKYYAETDEFIWFVHSHRGVPRCVLYDKSRGRSTTYPIDLVNDLTFDRAAPLIVGADAHYFIGQSDMYSVLDMLNDPQRVAPFADSAAQNRYRQMQEIANRSSENSNPVLTFIKFKHRS